MLRQTLALAGVVAALHVAGGSSAAQGAAAPSTSEPGEESVCINLNEASASKLVELPGIGPARAEAILEARHRRSFRRIEDILRVPGIGRKTFGRIRHRLCVE